MEGLATGTAAPPAARTHGAGGRPRANLQQLEVSHCCYWTLWYVEADHQASGSRHCISGPAQHRHYSTHILLSKGALSEQLSINYSLLCWRAGCSSAVSMHFVSLVTDCQVCVFQVQAGHG